MSGFALQPQRTRRMDVSMTLSLVIHAAIILGVGIPILKEPVEKTLRITFSTAAVERIDDSPKLSSSAQEGPDDIAQRKRSEAIEAAARPGNDEAGEIGQEGLSGQAETPVIARDSHIAARVSRESGLQAVTGGEEAAPEIRGEEEARFSAASSDIRAAYLEAWRHAVENIGNAQFPAELLTGETERDLILEVWLSSSGELLGTRVRQSSGKRELDQRARKIIESSAPYAAFPPAMAARHESLSFAYKWRFLAH